MSASTPSISAAGLLVTLIVAASGVITIWQSLVDNGRQAANQSAATTPTPRLYTDSAKKFSFSYPGNWTASNQPPLSGGDSQRPTEPDWNQTSRPVFLYQPKSDRQTYVTVDPGCQTTDDSGQTVPVLQALKDNNDRFHTQRTVTINGQPAFYDRLAFKGDAEQYTDHIYFVNDSDDCLVLRYRESWQHDGFTAVDNTVHMPGFRMVVDSVKFL